MLTIDDCNTIIQKYNNGYWIEYDLQEIGPDVGTIYEDNYARIEIINTGYQNAIEIYPKNNFMYSGYTTTHDGELLPLYVYRVDQHFEILMGQEYTVDMVILKLWIVPFQVDYSQYLSPFLIFEPISPLTKTVVNGEFDNKFYIKEIPTYENPEYYIDGVKLKRGTDEKGKFIVLPSANDCMIKPKSSFLHMTYLPVKISFIKFKELPIPYIPTLYKGTPQSIQVLNSEDDDPISDYQTYYQGRQLKENTIQLPYDSDDYVDIMVDLKDYRYPFCTLKLKAPTTIYQADSQSDVESAIENGIQTLQVGDNQNEVTLNSIELSNVTLINSNIQLTDSTITDCQIIDTVYTDNGGNTVTSTIFKDTDYNTTTQSNYNEVTFNECDIHDSEINLTGTITDSTITDTLIISDGTINIRDNTFTGVGAKEYFPSHLYLTGEYTVTGNSFTLEGEWTELEYNMCLIKATNDFNPSQFINQNTFDLNITYDDEPVNTFYYNIVDDDKIRAVRLN